MKNRIVIIIITLLLVIVGGYFGYEHIKEEYPSAFRVQITSDGHTEYVDYWEGPDGNIYVFLPGYVAYEDAVIALETSNDVYVGGQLLEDGMSCSAFEKDCFYEFSYTSWGHKYSYRIMFMQSANVATLYVDTASGNMDYIHEAKGKEESGEMVLYAADGALNYEGKIDSIKGRGNDTWNNYMKKPYSLKLEAGADLLNMGTAEKWILLANAKDASNLNNKIVFDFADRIGLAYTPDAEWVDVYLNNEYAGLYLLSERIEIGENRVNITPVSEDLDCSYIVSQEIKERIYNKEIARFETQYGLGFGVHEPEEITGLQLNEVALQFLIAENGIMAENDIDGWSGTHYADAIDVDSWARKYMVEEIFMNADAGHGSQYFYYDSQSEGTKIYAGPVWDYDNALAVQQIASPETLLANREYANREGYTPWLYHLYQKEDFYGEIVRLYREEFKAELQYLQGTQLPAYVAQIKASAKMNDARWFPGTENLFEQETEAIYEFLERRVAFLDRVWLDNMQYYTVSVETGVDSFYLYYTVPTEENRMEMPVLPEQEGLRFAGWYRADTNEPFDPEQPITGDMHIYAKWEATE